jgi:hypothetical protein
MELTANILQRLAHTEGVHHGKYAAERRKHQRLWMGRKATLMRHVGPGDHTPASVMVRDLSAAGVGLVSPNLMPVGTVFALVLSGGHDDAGARVTVECQTVRCDRASGGGAYIVGAQFLRVLAQKTPPEPAVV